MSALLKTETPSSMGDDESDYEIGYDYSQALVPRARKRCTCYNCSNSLNIRDEANRKLHRCGVEGCDKQYVKSSHYIIHMRSHMGIKPYECTWESCDKKFSRGDMLTRHYRTHTKEKTHACNACGKWFMRSDHLQKHLRIHLKNPGIANNTPPSSSVNEKTGIKRAAYDDECFNFERENVLDSFKDAMAVKMETNNSAEHDGEIEDEEDDGDEPTFQCSWNNCYRVFVTNDLLLEHLRLHAKVYTCKCGKVFKQRRSLDVHSAKFCQNSSKDSLR